MGLARALRLTAALLAGALCVLAGPVARFTISQARLQPGGIAAYLDIVDSDGHPVSGIAPEDFKVRLGNHAMRVTGLKTFDDTTEGVAYAFLMDVSKSISMAHFEKMCAAARTWVGALKQNDQMAIASFGDRYRLLVDFTHDPSRLTAALEPLAPTDGKTVLHTAIISAMQELQKRGDQGLPARRVIVVLSDGKDEGSAITDVDVARHVEEARIPVYTIGFSRLQNDERSRYLKTLERFSTLSGGIFIESAGDALGDSYAELRKAVRRVLVAQLSPESCEPNEVNRALPLEIGLSNNGKGYVDKVSASYPECSEGGLTMTEVVVMVLAAGALGAGIWWAFFRKKTVLCDKGLHHYDPKRHSTCPECIVAPVQTPRGGVALRFMVVRGREPGKAYKLRLVDRAAIGRAANCALVLAEDPRVGDRHCELYLASRRVMIRDLDKSKPTMMNGVPVVNRCRVEDRDFLTIGNTEMRITFEQA